MKALSYLLMFVGFGTVAFAIEFSPSTEQPPTFRLERQSVQGPAPFEGQLRYEPQWAENERGEFFLRTSPGESVYAEGLPVLPVQVQRIELPKGTRGRLVLKGWKTARSGFGTPMARAPKEKIWSPQPAWEFPPDNVGRLFPGKLVQTKQVGRTLILQWYPLQWDRETGELWRFEDVQWQVQTDSMIQRILIAPDRASTSLILTTRDMAEAARKLKAFHRQELNIESEIFTVEGIDATETPVAESTLPKGYKDEKDKKGSKIVPWNPQAKTGYHYERARKIIAFLRRRMGSASSVRYVTLLGDSTRVPPSYYYGMRSAFGSRFTPTDACYAAEDSCLTPRLAVGRLPLTSLEETERYLAKAKSWLREAPQAKHELALYGGKAFRGTHYIGELGTVRVLDYKGAGWRGAVKYHRTAGNYTKAGMTELARGNRDAAFVYHLDHGLGNRWYIESDYVTSKEIGALSNAPKGITPWVASISCINGAFDSEIVTSAGFGPKSGATSIGVSLLRSSVGAVAYFGSARPAIGQPLVNIDKGGNLEVKSTSYGLRLLDTFYRHYHDELGGRAGDRVLQAFQSYAYGQGHDMTNSRHEWTYFNAVFLGDPTLRFPVRKNFDSTVPVALSFTTFDKANWGIPSFKAGAKEYALDLKGPAAQAELLKVGATSEKKIDSFAVRGATTHTIEGKKARGLYLLKMENTEGVPREKRVWFRVR